MIVGVTCSSERGRLAQLFYEETSGSYMCDCQYSGRKPNAGKGRDTKQQFDDKEEEGGDGWPKVCKLHYWECPVD